MFTKNDDKSKISKRNKKHVKMLSTFDEKKRSAKSIKIRLMYHKN